jgi:hypothetical protein
LPAHTANEKLTGDELGYPPPEDILLAKERRPIVNELLSLAVADLTASFADAETAEAVRKAARKAEEKAEKAHDKTEDEVKNLTAALKARGQTAVRHEQVLAEQKEATAFG